MEKIRIDKWLWAVRIFKTRTLASDACAKGRVLINNMPVKPSKELVGNEIVTVRKPPVIYTYKIQKLVKSRLSAKLVPDFIEDLTSVEELDKLKINETFFVKRDRGAGRPTKKERRTIDKLNTENH
ncbi:MAG: RNA-binding S4 domain-containing protein [Bacteroidales bacterium]|nr:RNA-binding S4 domain-containing protein [Bacteroidales bacterium]MBN2819352.1 RNA-binding S4 domain-containing protein [Bacteroidales bacterium]